MQNMSLVFGLVLFGALASALDTGDNLVRLVKTGDTDTLLQQVGHGSLPDTPDKNGNLPLVAAVAKGDLKAMDFLLAYRANSSIIEQASGMTALTLAFSKGNAQAARLLLQYGGNPDQADKSGKSARELAKKSAQLQKLVALFDASGAEAFEDPPGTWSRHVAEGHETPYYHNAATGESRFMQPPSCAWVKVAVDGHPIYVNSITHQTKWTRPAALSWKHLLDKDSTEGYWFNYATDVTSYSVPAELPTELATELMYETGSYWHNTASKEASWVDPAEVTWREVTDPAGRKFWYHPKTMESVWERPKELSWRHVPSDQHPGHMYFFNDKTGDAEWEKPVELSWERATHNPHVSA